MQKRETFLPLPFEICFPAFKIKTVAVFFCRKGTRISPLLQHKMEKTKRFTLTALTCIWSSSQGISLLASPDLNWSILFPVPRIQQFDAYYEAHKTVKY